MGLGFQVQGIQGGICGEKEWGVLRKIEEKLRKY